MKTLKHILIIFCIFFPIGCVTTPHTPSSNIKTFSNLKHVELEDIDKNDDKVIDKDELEAYQHCNSPDSSTPLYVILFICGFTSLMCLLPKTCSFIKKKIKK